MTSPTPDPDPNRWTSPFEELLDQGTASPAHGPGPEEVHRPNPVIGTPGQDSAFWEGHQQLPDDCAIKCQQFILEQFTGQHISEGTLVGEAIDHGWFKADGQSGTDLPNVGDLLELHGVGVTHYDHASQFDLAHELAQGHKVIVCVEAGTLWNNSQHAGHAIVVSGIDTSDPQHVLVQVSDPGTGEALHIYPMEQFLEAWRGMNFSMVATDDPAPAHLPEMAHFDYEVGHIHDVAGMPYDQFIAYGLHPADLGDIVHHFVEHPLDTLGLGHDHFDDHSATEHHDDHSGGLDDMQVHHDPLLDPDHHHDGHDHADPADHLHDDQTTHDLI